MNDFSSTAFSRLSPTAQDLIVNAALGMYKESGPPKMTDEVKAEILKWAQENETVTPPHSSHE